MTTIHQSICTETVAAPMIIEIKDETVEYKSLRFFVCNVGDEDRTRPPDVYDLIYVGDSDDRRKRLKTV